MISSTDWPLSGIVWAYRFDAAGQATRLAPEAATDWQVPAGQFIWLHLDLVDRLARDWLSGTARLDSSARDSLLAGDEQPRLEHEGQRVWGVLPDNIQDIDDDTLRTAPLRFAFSEGYFVSGRRRPVRAAATMRTRIDAGQRVEGPIALFEAMIEHVLRGVALTLKELRAQADIIEDRVLEERLTNEARTLGPLRRTAVRLHRQLGGFLTILSELSGEQEDEPVPEAAREAAERLLQRIAGLNLEIQEVQDRARLLQDEVAAKLANETNRHLYALSIVTALLLPPTLVTGFFGMNTGGLPFVGAEHGWIGALVLGGISSLATFLLLRRLGFFE